MSLNPLIKRLTPVLVGSSLFLVGCGDPLTNQAIQSQQKQAEQVKKEDQAKKNLNKLYDSLKTKPKDAVKNTPVETKRLINQKVINRNSYSDPVEFAAFVAKEIFEFRNNSISPQDYYTFLKKFGAKKVGADAQQPVLKKKSVAIPYLSNLQSIIQQQGVAGTSYKLTELTFNATKKQAYFYRKVSSQSGDNYFITTIVLENGQWKFYEDNSSPGFTETTNGVDINGNGN